MLAITNFLLEYSDLIAISTKNKQYVVNNGELKGKINWNKFVRRLNGTKQLLTSQPLPIARM